jgi:hypothetical protein
LNEANLCEGRNAERIFDLAQSFELLNDDSAKASNCGENPKLLLLFSLAKDETFALLFFAWHQI